MLMLFKQSIDKNKKILNMFYQMPIRFKKLVISKTQFLKSHLLKLYYQTGPN
jgi:hypothetical protein